MTFLHPWAIALGLLGAGLPLAIHWLTKPRPIRLPLSTVRFVREAIHQRRARHRLRDLVILGLRVLALVALAFAVSRPQWGTPPLVTPGEPGTALRVVIFDVSQSMAADHHGVPLFERARPLVAGYLAEQSDLQANLILAGARPRASFDRLSPNVSALREEVARARALPERLNVQAALDRAAEMLARAGDESSQRRELVIVSDFQRSNWAAADFSVLPEDTRVQLDSVALAQPLANLAILRVGSPDRLEQGREVRLEVEVGNFSPGPRLVHVEVTLGDAVYRLQGTCPPNERTTLMTDIPLHGTGWQVGDTRLVNVADALAADNVRPVALEIRPAPVYALITTQPADQVPSSSYYLERALSPLAGRGGRSEARVLRIDPAHLDRDSLASADVLVLDHPGRLSTASIQLLATLLRRGRGILYVTATAQDAATLKLLADAAGSDLQLPVDFMPAPASQRRRDLFLLDVRREQAPFRVFGEGLTALTSGLRFSGGLATQRRTQALDDDVLAHFSDRSAGLVVSACGEGSLAVLNADLAASNLPASPVFVPLLGELVGRLLGRQRHADAIACGEPSAVYLPASAGSATGLLTSGPEHSDAGQLVEESSGVLWRSQAFNTPGVYQVKRQGVPVLSLAAAIPAVEADLRPLEPGVLPERLAGGRKIHYRTANEPDTERDHLWVWLAVACVVFSLSELLALKLYRT